VCCCQQPRAAAQASTHETLRGVVPLCVRACVRPWAFARRIKVQAMAAALPRIVNGCRVVTMFPSVSMPASPGPVRHTSAPRTAGVCDWYKLSVNFCRIVNETGRDLQRVTARRLTAGRRRDSLIARAGGAGVPVTLPHLAVFASESPVCLPPLLSPLSPVSRSSLSLSSRLVILGWQWSASRGVVRFHPASPLLIGDTGGDPRSRGRAAQAGAAAAAAATLLVLSTSPPAAARRQQRQGPRARTRRPWRAPQSGHMMPRRTPSGPYSDNFPPLCFRPLTTVQTYTY